MAPLLSARGRWQANPGMTVDKLVVPRAHWEILSAHAARCWPEEACGLLGGLPGLVHAVYLVENSLHSRTAYLMAPADQVGAMTDIEARGWEVVGIFHSHPAGPETPSASDIAQAYYPEAVYVILAPGEGGVWQGRGFFIAAGTVQEVGLELRE